MYVAHQYDASKSLQFWQRVCASASVFLTLSCPIFACAQDEGASSAGPTVSLHGFGTLGLTRTTTDNAQFVRDLSQPNGAAAQWNSTVDSLLGVQANVQFSPSTEGVVQMVSRYHADSSYRPELTWAFLRHDFSPDLSVRAGRLGTEFYMLGDSRLVGYSNLNVRPSSDFYGSLVFSYIDGLDVSATLPVASGLLKGKVFWGQSPEKTPYTPGILWNLQGSELAGGYLDYSTGPWQFRLSHAQVRFNRDMPADELLQSLGYPPSGTPFTSQVPEMSMANRRARFSSVGLVYDQGPLNVQLMINQIKHDSLAYLDSKAGYVLAAYRLGALTPYVGMSKTLTEPMPAGLDPFTNLLVVHSITDQTTYTVGSRWDFHKNLSFKAQVDQIRGKPSSVYLLKGTESGTWDGHMTVFSLALDFVF